jgi:hypothetical protein
LERAETSTSGDDGSSQNASGDFLDDTSVFVDELGGSNRGDVRRGGWVISSEYRSVIWVEGILRDNVSVAGGRLDLAALASGVKVWHVAAVLFNVEVAAWVSIKESTDGVVDVRIVQSVRASISSETHWEETVLFRRCVVDLEARASGCGVLASTSWAILMDINKI